MANPNIEEITLHNTLIRVKRGMEANLPAEAPEGQLLLSMGPGQWKLWSGAGAGNPIQLIGGGGTGGGASFIVDQANHQLDKVFVMYNASTGLWEKAYASYDPDTDTSYTAVGFATKMNDDQFTVTMLGEQILGLVEGTTDQSFVDVDGNNLVPGEFYYLCQNPENAGKVQREKPVFGVIQLVLEAITVDEILGTKIVLFTQEAVDTENETYGGQQRIIFNEASLNEAGKFTITHALNSTAISVSVYDNNGTLIIPDEVQVVDQNTVDISLTNFFRPIVGTWTAILIGGTQRDNSESFNSYTTTFDQVTDITITHNLGTLSVVTSVYDETGLKIEPYKLQVVDLNNIRLLFDIPVSGKIVISGNGIGTFTGIDFKTADDIPSGQINKYFNESIMLGLMNEVKARNTIVSDWMLIQAGGNYTFEHNLSDLEYEVDYYVTDGIGTVVTGCVNQTGDESTGVTLMEMGPASVRFAVGDNAIFSIKSGSIIKAPTNGRLRVIVKRRTFI